MFTGGIGRKAVAKLRHTPGDKVRWPVKATKVILDLLVNAEANADMRGLDVDELSIVHAQANRAPKTRRRTYRAHGRIGPYMALPAHCELVLAKAADLVKKGKEEGEEKVPKIGAKRSAQLRIKTGGGVE
jgi:large subunit ribosomal protein L17e